MIKSIFRRAVRNVVRIPGRSLLMGTILLVIAVFVLVGLSIEAGTRQSIKEARKSLGNEVRLQPNMNAALKLAQSKQGQSQSAAGMMIKPEDVTESIGKKLINSKYVVDYDFNINSFVSTDLEPVEVEAGDTGNKSVMIQNKNGSSETPELRLTGNLKPELQADFYNGDKKMIEGRFYTKEDIDAKANVAVIDKLLAEKNNLKVGDSFKVKSITDQNEYSLEVIGIFEDSVQSETQIPLPLMVRANTIYVPYSVLQRMSVNGTERPADFVNSVSYYLDDPLHIDAFRKEAESLGIDLEKYALDANDNAFTKMVGPMQKLADFAKAGVIAILITGALIMVLLMTIITRERKAEVGILRALGAKHTSVALQFAAEAVMICFVALVAGGIIGTAVSQSTAEYMLKREVAVQKEAEFGKPIMIGMGQEFNKSLNAEAVDSMAAVIGYEQILQLVLVGLFTCICGTLASTYWIMKYEPMKILSSRT